MQMHATGKKPKTDLDNSYMVIDKHSAIWKRNTMFWNTRDGVIPEIRNTISLLGYLWDTFILVKYCDKPQPLY